MGRWDNDDRYRYYGGGRGTRRDYRRIAKFVIVGGFVVLGAFMLTFFVSRAGLHVAIHERSEAVGTVRIVTVQITNNSFETIRNVTVQFGDTGTMQQLGDMGPFAGALVSPDSDDDVDFDKVIVTANDGAINVVKYRNGLN